MPPPAVMHTNPVTAAASSALARDIPGVGKYSAMGRHVRSRAEKNVSKDELAPYRSRVEAGAGGGLGHGGGEADVEFLTKLESIDDVATLEQRWVGSWTPSLHGRYDGLGLLSFGGVICISQRSQTAPNTAPLKKVQTVPDMPSHPHQTRTESPVRAIQD